MAENNEEPKMDAGFIYWLNGNWWDNMIDTIWDSNLNVDHDTICMICGM